MRMEHKIRIAILLGTIVLGKVSAGFAAVELPAVETRLTRIAFGSCAKQWQHQPIWDAVIAAKPDLFLFIGDAVYADTDSKTAWPVTAQQLKGEWNRLADKPEFQAARAAFPFMATWDNHDYGTHAGGVEFPLKQTSQAIFLDFFGEPADSKRSKTPGIYDAKIFGQQGRRVQIILLDTRYFKDRYKKDQTPKADRLKAGKVGAFLPDNDPSKMLLGKEQWVWLAEQLKQPAEIRLIVSSIQIIPNQKGMDEWGNFPRERQRLLDLVGKTSAKGIILLSGNVHFAELSQSDVGAYPLFELTSSGMTHIDRTYARAANDCRIAGPFTEHNVGMIEIDWETEPSSRITLKVIGEDGKTGFSKTIALTDLQNDDSKNEQKMVACTEPRPQICPQDYRPVCAVKQDGNYKTYSNGCGACSDPAVTGFRDGSCK